MIDWARRERREEFSDEGMCPPSPMFFVSTDSKGVAVEIFVSADSERLKAAVFSVICEWLVSADSKGFSGPVSPLFSAVTRNLGTADSEKG